MVVGDLGGQVAWLKIKIPNSEIHMLGSRQEIAGTSPKQYWVSPSQVADCLYPESLFIRLYPLAKRQGMSLESF